MDESISEQIAAVEESLSSLDALFGPLESLDYDNIVKRMSSLDQAKYDLTNLYAINSLFWMYMRSFGEDPKSLPTKEEMDRIKIQMLRVKELSDKSKMPRLDKGAAGRMIRHELWTPKAKGPAPGAETPAEDWEVEEGEIHHDHEDGPEPMETDGAEKNLNGDASTDTRRKRKYEEITKTPIAQSKTTTRGNEGSSGSISRDANATFDSSSESDSDD